jgi:hypothetical protein
MNMHWVGSISTNLQMTSVRKNKSRRDAGYWYKISIDCVVDDYEISEKAPIGLYLSGCP